MRSAAYAQVRVREPLGERVLGETTSVGGADADVVVPGIEPGIAFTIDDRGRLWLQPTVALPRAALTALRRLGVQLVKENGALQAEEVSCWLQILPVQKDAEKPLLSSQAPVLFELSRADQLPALVGEVLRLGNDRQSFRWLDDGQETRAQVARRRTHSRRDGRRFTERRGLRLGGDRLRNVHLGASLGKGGIGADPA